MDDSGEHVEPTLSDLAKRGWRRSRIPSGFEVVQLDHPFKESDEISKLAADVQAGLTDAGIQSAVVTAHLLAPTGKVDSSGGYALNLVGSPDLSAIYKLFEVAVGSSAPANTDSKGSPDGGGDPPTPQGNNETAPQAKADAAKTTVAPPALADPAATIAATIPAFPDPLPLWAYIGQADRDPLARALVSSLNESRTKFARRSEWVVAPEMVLLDACASDQREDLAKRMLEVRAALTDADKATRDATAKLAAERTALAGERVKFASKGVELAGETLKHMQKWRSIANIGLWVLGFTTAFSMAAVGYVLLYLAPNEDVSDAVIPIIVFVLALFAISPAVLLLRERPLEGLDKWSPPTGTGDSTSTTEPDASSAAASPSVAETPTQS